MIYITFGEWMSSFWWVFPVGLLALFIIFLIGLHIFTLVFALTFKMYLHKDSNSINLLLAQRRETALEIVKIALSHDVEISKDDIKGINRLERVEDFQALKKEDRDERIFSFIRSSYNVIHLCNSSRKISNDKRYEPLLDLYNGVEQAYRQKVAKYNSDVLGYNYWIKVPGTKLFYKFLLRFKEKDLLV